MSYILGLLVASAASGELAHRTSIIGELGLAFTNSFISTSNPGASAASGGLRATNYQEALAPVPPIPFYHAQTWL